MLKSFEVQSGRLATLFICGSKETNRSIEIKMTWIYHQMQLKLNYSQGSLRRSNQCLQKIWRLISRALLKNNRMPCKESLSVQKLFQMKLVLFPVDPTLTQMGFWDFCQMSATPGWNLINSSLQSENKFSPWTNDMFWLQLKFFLLVNISLCSICAHCAC